MKKRILTLFMAFVMVFAIAFTAFAEEPIQEESAPTSEEIANETSNTINTILGISVPVGVGAMVIAVIVFFLKNLKTIKNVVSTMANVFKSIFSKDGNVENVPQAFKGVENELKALGESFNNELTNVKTELEKEKEESAQLKHILSVFIINSTYINPYAKNELIKLICGEKQYGETVEETINTVAATVEEAKALEEKPLTPCLDKVTSEQ